MSHETETPPLVSTSGRSTGGEGGAGGLENQIKTLEKKLPSQPGQPHL